MLTRLNRRSRRAVSDLNRQPGPGRDLTHVVDDVVASIVLARAETPLTVTPQALLDAGNGDRRATVCEMTVLGVDAADDGQYRDTWPIVSQQNDPAELTVDDDADELRHMLVAGSRIRIDGSTDAVNDDVYELTAIVFDDTPSPSTTTLSLSRALPDIDDTSGDVVLTDLRTRRTSEPGDLIRQAVRPLHTRLSVGDVAACMMIGDELIPLTAFPFIEGYLLEPCDSVQIDPVTGIITPSCARVGVFDMVPAFDDDGEPLVDDDDNPVRRWVRVGQDVVANMSRSATGERGEGFVAFQLGNQWRPFFDCGGMLTETQSIDDLLDLTIWEE